MQSSSMPTPEARSYNATIWLDVAVEGREPSPGGLECMVQGRQASVARQTLPVVVDRENPERIDIQWEELQTIDERMAAGGPSAAARASPRGTTSPSSSAARASQGARAAPLPRAAVT